MFGEMRRVGLGVGREGGVTFWQQELCVSRMFCAI